MKIRSIFVMMAAAALFTACGGGGEGGAAEGDAQAAAATDESKAMMERLEDPARAEWQQPEVVIGSFPDLNGKTVADIGAGTGYFSFPVAEQAGKVLAIDIDQAMLDYIEDKKGSSGTGSNIETRLTTADNPGLEAGEADAVLIVNTFHHIGETEDRQEWLMQLREGMKEDAVIIIVDFKKLGKAQVGPPMDERLFAQEVEADLQAVGFSRVRIDNESLKHQYLVKAM